jgi:hypothetical protein
MLNPVPLGDHVQYKLTLAKTGGGAPLVLEADKPMTIPAVGAFFELDDQDGTTIRGTVADVETRYDVSGERPILICHTIVTLAKDPG